MSLMDPRPQSPRCSCGHQAVSHRRNSKGYRAQCSNLRCGCRMFVLARAVRS